VKILADFRSAPSLAVLVEALRQRGARRYSHSGRRLLDHLLGTWTVLRQWGQPLSICRAGLFHSCYSTYAYPTALFTMKERSLVRALIGSEAEELVHNFCTLDWKKLLRSALASGEIPEPGLLVVSFRSGQSYRLQQTEAALLLLLEMANLAEQSRRKDGAPGLGLTKVAALGRLLRPLVGIVPEVFDGCSATLDRDNEETARVCYLKALDCMAADPAAAQALLDRAARANPWVGEISLQLALLALHRQEWEATRSKAEAGTQLLRQWGTSWDKRHGWRDWLRLGERLARVSARAASQPSRGIRQVSERWFELARDPFVFIATSRDARKPSAGRVQAAGYNPLGGEAAGWKRFERYMGRFLTNGNSPAMTWYPGLAATPWHDPAVFPAVEALEAGYPAIRTEYESLKDSSGFQPEMEPLERTGQWNVFMLYERGRKNAANCARCPETVRIIESIPAVRTLAGMIYFSDMVPGTHIVPHKGPTNMRVRCHLGIHVPADCAMRVGKETRTWEAGKCLVFDDSFEHEVWNNSDQTRTVLIVDLWHPDLAAIEVEALEGLHRYAEFYAERLPTVWRRNEAGRKSMEAQKRWL